MKLKYLIPFDSFRLYTHLKQAEVQKRLETVTESRGGGLQIFKTRTMPYEGEITSDGFDINRIIRYRNSFLPDIIGKVSSIINGTEIQVKMRPNWGGLIFMAFWLGLSGIASLVILSVALVNFRKTLALGLKRETLIPFALFAFGYVMLMIGYRIESEKSKEFIKLLLEADEG